jgi:isocitrate/isopropylmalate dehydrogenase
MDLKTIEAAAMDAAASAAISDPGDFGLICVSGLFSVIVSGLCQQL